MMSSSASASICIQPSKQAMHAVAPSKPHKGRHMIPKNGSSMLPLKLLRVLLLDFPLFLLFAAYISVDVLEQVHRDYFIPLRSAMKWTEARQDVEVTSYHYVCTPDDITAESADELVIQPDWSTSQILEHHQIHGATMFPSILSNTTADTLRSFILEENQRQEGFYVISNKNRYSFGIQVDQDPSIAPALHEIATHPRLKPLLEQLVGRNPAIIEFTAITSTFGAEMQNYHQDVVPEGSAAKYARTFIPSYSLFIPLQDTTQQMGATEICPGTQMCGDGTSVEEVCREHAVPASGTANKWPKGWGALVNQQTTHRGTAHVDAGVGQERVVFILTFAPRPQYDNGPGRSLPGVVESRMIGQGGSYSMNWQHWGHTLEDFGNAPRNMAQPWRTLRALGLYKPRGSDWGWDMPSVAWMRIANGEVGYNRDTLEEFVDKGGFAWLPTWLQGDIWDNEEEDNWEADGGWHEFLVSTLQKVKEALAMVHNIVLWVLAMGLALVSIGTAVVQRKALSGVSIFVRTIARVLILHGVVLALAWYFLMSLSQTHWSRHVQSGKLFQPYSDPTIHTLATTTASEDMNMIDLAPYTLPNRRDVLVAPHYQSRYLASYANILEYNQPGNLAWRELVKDHSAGFAGLSLSLQEHLCEFLVFDTTLQTHFGRFLQQAEAGRWTELEDAASIDFCRRELLREQASVTKTLMRELDYLKSETKFGAWRHAAIHKSTIARYLDVWSDRILGTSSRLYESVWEHTPIAPSVISTGVRKQLSIEITSTKPHRQKSRLPYPPPPVSELFSSAWLTTGDVVEGMYQGQHNEYYRGVLIDASPERNSYDVRYDDGEEDVDLCRMCVRPFKPYRVKELVEARVDEETFSKAYISAHYPHKDMYEVRFLDDGGEEPFEVFSSDLRRFR